MAQETHAISSETFGAWLLKARPDGLPLAAIDRSGFAEITSRCVRPSYRTDLIRQGQPVLLWVSGADLRHPSGIHAVGVTTGPARADGAELSMPVLVRSVDPVIGRHEIGSHPTLAAIEVLKMPAGSNPSYLDTEQYRCLLETFPQLSPR